MKHDFYEEKKANLPLKFSYLVNYLNRKYPVKVTGVSNNLKLMRRKTFNFYNLLKQIL